MVLTMTFGGIDGPGKLLVINNNAALGQRM
jgi:hypothetical protein